VRQLPEYEGETAHGVFLNVSAARNGLQLLYEILLEHLERLDDQIESTSQGVFPTTDRSIFIHMHAIEGLMADSGVVGAVPLLRLFGFIPLASQRLQHSRGRMSSSGIRLSDESCLMLPESSEVQLRNGLRVLLEHLQQLPEYEGEAAQQPPVSPRERLIPSSLSSPTDTIDEQYATMSESGEILGDPRNDIANAATTTTTTTTRTESSVD